MVSYVGIADVASNGCFSEWLRRCQEKHSNILCPHCRGVVQFVGRNHFLHGIEEVLLSVVVVISLMSLYACVHAPLGSFFTGVLDPPFFCSFLFFRRRGWGGGRRWRGCFLASVSWQGTFWLKFSVFCLSCPPAFQNYGLSKVKVVSLMLLLSLALFLVKI